MLPWGEKKVPVDFSVLYSYMLMFMLWKMSHHIIAINQDVTPQGRPVEDGDLTVWAHRLSGGDIAVALYNEEDSSQNLGFTLSAIGWHGDDACVRDLWEHADVSKQLDKQQFGPLQVAPHEAKVYRVSKCEYSES